MEEIVDSRIGYIPKHCVLPQLTFSGLHVLLQWNKQYNGEQPMVRTQKRKVYRDMQEYLLTQIRQGELSSGQMIPDEFSLAASFKISRRSVRQGLKELVDRGMLMKQQGKGTFVTKAEEWQSLDEQEDRPLRLLLVYPSYSEKTFQDPFNQSLLAACMETAHKHGHEIIFSAATADTGKLLRHYESEKCDGILWVMAFEICHQTIQDLHAHGIPIVTINQELPNISSVMIESDLAMRTMIGFLYQLGHKRIGFLNVSPHETVYVNRRDGFMRYLAEYGLPRDYYCEAEFEPQVFLPRVQFPWDKELFPSALIVGGHLLLIPVLSLLETLGLKVGVDVSLICIDDNLAAQLNNPPISAYYEPRELLGKEAINLLAEMIYSNSQKASRLFVRGFLITRESCRMPRDLHDKVFPRSN